MVAVMTESAAAGPLTASSVPAKSAQTTPATMDVMSAT